MHVVRARRLPVAVLLWAAAAPGAVAAGLEPDAGAWQRVAALLDSGRVREADSLYGTHGARRNEPSGHLREIVAARLAAVRGDWNEAEQRLRAWKLSPLRREGSGEIFFWLGWAALHQGRAAEADSLFVLASAHVDEARSQHALEYRFVAMLEHPPALLDYLRGLPESPLPANLRITSLERVPESSRLHSEARWRLARLLGDLGDSARAAGILAELARDVSTPAGRRAAARLAYLRETAAADSARRGYEELLLKQQQGVSSEFSRGRLERLRNAPPGPAGGE